MNKKLINSDELKKEFLEMGYYCMNPHSIVNNAETLFITAGIQPILKEFQQGNISSSKKVYISQPVIRTQFIDSLSEGTSLSFVNLTTSGFNISEYDHEKLIRDWMELFFQIGLKPENFSKKCDEYKKEWGDLLVSGKRTFFYYNGLEIGDTTFFTDITKYGKKIGIETMSDVGFGLERIRWIVNQSSYYNLYSDSSNLLVEIKAYLSAIALLTVNGIKPSNKNIGYRMRLFSKRLVSILKASEFSEEINNYLFECIQYWKDWQEINGEIDIEVIKREYIRNGNRFIIDYLINQGYDNVCGIDINVSREDFFKRLKSSNVDKEQIRKLFK